MKATGKQIRGRIVIIQEDRFRLVDTTGRGYLFSLPHSTDTSPADLQRWHDAGVGVMVAYTGEPGFSTGIARQVDPLQ